MRGPRSELLACYDHHGIHVVVRVDDEEAMDAVGAILDYFGYVPRADVPAAPDVELVLQSHGAPPAVPGGASRMTKHNGLCLWCAGGSYFLGDGDTMIRVDPATGKGWGVLRSPLWRKPGVARLETVNLILHAVLLSLRHRGFYLLHAAALTKGDESVLLVAAGDCGKSTQALHMVRQGWRYLTDDSLLLCPGASRVEARGLRQDFGMDPAAAARFPEIAAHWRPFLTDERKRRIDMAALFPGQRAVSSVPRTLLFPRITPAAESRLRPVRGAEALCRLMEQSVLLTLDPATAPAHMDALRRLVRQTRAYALEAGRDLLEDGTRLTRMLEALPTPHPDAHPHAFSNTPS